MPDKKTSTDQIIAEARRNRASREKTYRERALKMFPWICGRCGREFSGKRLRELTVHHKDHNHDYNPPDGSNWELLCLYCHDNEHSRDEVAEAYGGHSSSGGEEEAPASANKPFADLAALLQKTDHNRE
jgi:HNH endonuclease